MSLLFNQVNLEHVISIFSITIIIYNLNCVEKTLCKSSVFPDLSLYYYYYYYLEWGDCYATVLFICLHFTMDTFITFFFPINLSEKYVR